jgi:hypothetical protein
MFGIVSELKSGIEHFIVHNFKINSGFWVIFFCPNVWHSVPIEIGKVSGSSPLSSTALKIKGHFRVAFFMPGMFDTASRLKSGRSAVRARYHP